MKKAILNLTASLASAFGSMAISPFATAAPALDNWQQLTTVDTSTQSRLAFSHWPNDKYPQLPELTARAKTVMLDVDGPGVVTLFHVSRYEGGDQSKLILRVWYDGEPKPAIEADREPSSPIGCSFRRIGRRQ